MGRALEYTCSEARLHAFRSLPSSPFTAILFGLCDLQALSMATPWGFWPDGNACAYQFHSSMCFKWHELCGTFIWLSGSGQLLKQRKTTHKLRPYRTKQKWFLFCPKDSVKQKGFRKSLILPMSLISLLVLGQARLSFRCLGVDWYLGKSKRPSLIILFEGQ